MRYPLIRAAFDSDFFTPSAFDKFFNFTHGNDTNYMTVPRANVIKNENGYSIQLAAPGFSREEFEMSVDNNTLIVQVGTSDTPDYEHSIVNREYKFQSFTRSWSLPENTNTESITARYEAGILYIDIPIENHRKSKKVITVE